MSNQNIEEELLTPSQYSYVMRNIKDIDLAQIQVDRLSELCGISEELKIHSSKSEYPEEDLENTCDSDQQCDSTMNNTNINSGHNILSFCSRFGGPFDFQLVVPSDDSHKWIYSPMLNKIFIDIDKVLVLHFKWNYWKTENKQLYVRAVPIYTKNEHINIPVKRCPVHMMSDNPLNTGFGWVEHVIRCEDYNTEYEQQHVSGRLSCVTPLDTPQPGVDNITLTYKFMCKTSCHGGMDRRSIAVIFTLEDRSRYVYGKQCLEVKICSCPKRDKLKEEHKRVTEREEYLFNHKNKKKLKTSAKNKPCISLIKAEDDGHDRRQSLIVSGLDRKTYELLLTSLYDAFVGKTVRCHLTDTHHTIEQLKMQLDALQEENNQESLQ